MTPYLLAALGLLLLAATVAAAYRFIDSDGAARPVPPRPDHEDWHPQLPSRPYSAD